MERDVLLISEQTLKKYTLINNNVDGVYLLPAIRVTQDIDLSTVIGPVLVNKLQDLVANGEIELEDNKNYKKLLDNYVTPYLVWQTMAAVQINLNYKFSNSGMISNDDDRKSHLDYQNNKNLQTQYDRYAASYAMKLKNFLCSHSNDYPEYKQCENYEGEEDPMLCSIFLGDISHRNKCYIGK